MLLNFKKAFIISTKAQIDYIKVHVFNYRAYLVGSHSFGESLGFWASCPEPLTRVRLHFSSILVWVKYIYIAKCLSYTHSSVKCPSYTHSSVKCPSYTHSSVKCPSYTRSSVKCPSYTHSSVKWLFYAHSSVKCLSYTHT